MLLSMTGYGAATVQLPDKKITADIKSLNSKQMDLAVRLPGGLRAMELELRGLVTSALERGKADMSVTVENAGGNISTVINADAVAAYAEQIKRISADKGIPLPTDWYNVLLKLPEVLTNTENKEPQGQEELQTAVIQTVSQAVAALMEHRRAEGLKLEEFFTLRIDKIRDLLAQVPKYEAERIERIHARLADGLSKIPAVEYDKGRLEQEMIFYIEKLDVNEEKQRLSQHLDYFMSTMSSAHPGQGKKLGFIAQEMGREINTLGSKSNHADMQQLVVRMKDELEQIKEQVLNVM